MDDKLKLLIKYINDPAVVKSVHDEVVLKRGTLKDSCGAVLSTMLLRAGFPQSYGTWAETEATELKAEGWKLIEAAYDPQAGDVFVCHDLNDNGATDHIGFVLKMDRPGFFWAVDNRNDLMGQDKRYIRNIDGVKPRTPVKYWLRYQGTQA
jgi:hypothetical protein